MNICKSDLYFIITILLFLYLNFKIYNKNNKIEGFDTTSDIKQAINQIYNADIEAIRNLSSIASTLTTSGGLTVPGNLIVKQMLWTSGGTAGGGMQTHFPYSDGRNYIRGDTSVEGTLYINGDTTLAGNTKIGGGIGAFMIDTSNNVFPIFSSILAYSTFNINDKDKYYILLPGYKLILYTNASYDSQTNDILDNTVGSTPLFKKLNVPNNGSSCKLYYLNKEVTISGIS
jgi:hypothetical protein